MSANIKKIFLLSVFLKLIFIPWFYHPDIKSQYFHFQFLNSGFVNIYQYIAENKSSLPYQDTFNYLPLTYFTFGSYHTLIANFVPTDFKLWLNDWGENQNDYANLPVFLLFLKIPYLLLDILVGYIIFKLLPHKKTYLFWLFNPLVFYFIYILQNFDIVPVFLTVLSYLLLTKQKLSLGFLVFGLSIALKLYSILLLPFFIISLKPNFLSFIKYSIIAMLPLIITCLPFTTNTYFLTSFMGSGLTQKIFETNISNIPVFPAIYLIILIYSWLHTPTNIIKNISLIFLLFVSTVNFHPQWLLWFYPFFLLYSSTLISHLIFIPIFFRIFLIDDNYLTWGHLIPIDPLIVKTTTLFNLIRFKYLYNPFIVQNYLKTVLMFWSLVQAILYEKNHRT